MTQENNGPVGEIINYRYEILEKLGEGAFFNVYRTRDKVRNRLVALKMLKTELSEYREFSTAVCSSYKGMAVLSHPNIASAIESENVEGNCYISCDFVRGASLRDRLRKSGALEPRHAIDIIIPVLEALNYSHSSQVVHGDIRPEDIIISPDGEVKLTDFGLSYALMNFPHVVERTAFRSVHYQAPEVTAGGPPTIASDIYSIGAVLYEMITGRPPHDGPTAVAVAMRKVKGSPVEPAAVNTAIAQSLSDLVMRAMSFDAHDRFGSAQEMLAELKKIRENLRLGVTGPTSSQKASAATREPVVARHGRETTKKKDQSLGKQFLFIMVVFLVSLALALGATLYFSGFGRQVRVPVLIGKSFDEASLIAQEKGFTLTEEDRVNSEKYREHQIISQIPEAGETLDPRGDMIVKVRVSKGPSKVRVPDLVGLTETSAIDMAVDSGFIIDQQSVTYDYHKKVPAGNVISQNPLAGQKRPPDTPIKISVSLGPSVVDDDQESGQDENIEDVEGGNDSPGVRNEYVVEVPVPEGVEGPQNVRIVVVDNRGETVEYDMDHQPGERFEVRVGTVGQNPRIKVYVGGRLESDETY